jgi:hypothetical protein
VVDERAMLKPSRLVAAVSAIFAWISLTFVRLGSGANVAISTQAASDTRVVSSTGEGVLKGCTLPRGEYVAPLETQSFWMLHRKDLSFAGVFGPVDFTFPFKMTNRGRGGAIQFM